MALGAWLLVFAAYEVLERTVLAGVDGTLLNVLHILRGSGTSFLLAGLVAWYHQRWFRRPPPEHAPIDGLRMIVAETEARELVQQAVWIIQLRWAAVAGVALTAVAARTLFGAISGTSLAALLVIAAGMAAYNLAFARWRYHEPRGVRLAFAQSFLDLAALTLMLCFTGGVGNPFFLFYMFHIVIAGILLRRTETFVITASACLLFCGMVVLQETGLIPSFPLLDDPLGPPARTASQVAGVLAAFVVTAWCTAYFTTTIVDKLRRRGVQVLEAGEILAQERAKTEDIVRSVGAALVISDLEDRILWANPIAEDWFGADLRGRPCHEALWGERERAAGDVGLPKTAERTRTRNGRKRCYLANRTPIKGPDGRAHQVLELIQDITATKELQTQLTQAGKMAAVGQLAAGIAHEINNPLAVVASSAELLADAIREGRAAAAEKHLQKIESNVFRCTGIIENLLAFARRGGDAPGEVDLEALLDDTVQLVQSNARSRGREIRRRYGGVGSLTTQGQKVQQVVLNLLMNAVDATGPGDVVTLTAERTEGGVEITVEDTGCGIAPEHLEHLFEPFFTTKPVGQGTGLGLYLSHQFVEAMGGRISVRSRPGEGSSFKVVLPDARIPAGRTP